MCGAWKTSSRQGVRFVSPLQSLLRYIHLSLSQTHTLEHVIYIKTREGGRDLNVECQLGAYGLPVPLSSQLYCRLLIPTSADRDGHSHTHKLKHKHENTKTHFDC